MGLTSNQQTAVETNGKPLFIQAGAGTGKTFTLTKRLGFGLSEESGPVIPGVDSLLTITFTNKAAGELLGRVRAELRARGLHDAALKVDSAWISTIHSMCRNMLQEHAFDAGIDAGAELLSEEESTVLLEQAVDELFGSHAQDARLVRLLDAYGAEKTRGMLCGTAAGYLQLAPEGARSFDLGPQPGKPDANIVQAAAQAAARALDELVSLGAPDTKTCQASFDKVQQSADLLAGFLAGGMSEELSWEDLLSLFEACPLTRGGNVKKQYKPVFGDAYAALLHARAVCAVAVSRSRCEAVLQLGEAVLGRHRELKRAMGAVDTGDLLIEAYRLLRDNPKVAESYRRRFASIMVDEFQDTDALQVQIVERICDETLSSLATVGDAQQSIYGFRGADLEVYRDVRKQMKERGSVEVSLDTNYRSHAAILGFVEDIFSTDGFFGGEFLKVGSGLQDAPACAWHGPHDPRVRILFSAGGKDPETTRKRTSIAALRKADAEALAAAFEQYAQAGASYGDMAILMRSTKNAQVFIDALAARGIQSVVSGGSTFYTLDEIGALTALLRVLENRDDDEALYSVLASPVFDVTDTDLLALNVVSKGVCRLAPDDARIKPSLFDALQRLCTADAKALDAMGVGKPSPLLENAYAVVRGALDSVGTHQLSTIVLSVARKSGWREALRGQGAAGMAAWANIERFADLVDEYQASHGAHVLGIAEHFCTMRKLAQDGAGARGKPGVMASFDNDAVRIMTIHASKGLEFPIVAVAEFDSSQRRGSGGVRGLSESGTSYLFMRENVGKEVEGLLAEHARDVPSLHAASSTLAFGGLMRETSRQRDEQEAQRLLYVALTRARDTLILVAHDSTFLSTGELAKGLFADVMGALWQDSLPQPGTVERLRCGELVSFEVSEVPYSSCGGEEADGPVQHGTRQRTAPVCEEEPEVLHRVVKQQRFWSYSTLAHAGSSAGTDSLAKLRGGPEKAETVSSVGSAFHLVAQWMAQGRAWTDEELGARIDAAVLRYGLDAAGRARLEQAVRAWGHSERFGEARSFKRVHAEYPFAVYVGEVPLEGYMDLLCANGSDTPALVIDYKTGTSGGPAELRERYELQACCYAYAVIELGLAPGVKVVFIRPEADMEEVVFEYGSADKDALQAKIAGVAAGE